MAKFSKKTVDKIVGLVKSDTYTIAEICRQVGITPKTYHQWVNDYPDFADAIEQAKEERMQFFVQEAKKSLLKKIQGYEVTETKVVTIPGKKKDERGNPKPEIKEQTTTKKHIQADTAAIIFTLTNGDPDQLFNVIYNARVKFLKDITTSSIAAYEKRIGRKATEKELMKHTNKRFLNGWLRRLADIKNI